jgi:hypothetical protein
MIEADRSPSKTTSTAADAGGVEHRPEADASTTARSDGSTPRDAGAPRAITPEVFARLYTDPYEVDGMEQLVEALIGSPSEGVMEVSVPLPGGRDRRSCSTFPSAYVAGEVPDAADVVCNAEFTRCVHTVPDEESPRSRVLLLQPRPDGGRRWTSVIYHRGDAPASEDAETLRLLEQRAQVCQFHDALVRNAPSLAGEPYFEVGETDLDTPLRSAERNISCGEAARARSERWLTEDLLRLEGGSLICSARECRPDYGESNHISEYELWLAGERPDGSLWLLAYLRGSQDFEVENEAYRQRLQRRRCPAAR